MPNPLPRDQDWCHWQGVWQDNLDSGLVLPAQGSDTQWYKNVLQKPSMRIDARGAEGEFRAIPITKAEGVKAVIGKSPGEVRGESAKYSLKFDMAVVVELE